MPNAEIADWCHECKYAADLLQDRGADPEVILFLRNASKYAAAFKVAQALETPEEERSWLHVAAEELDMRMPTEGYSYRHDEEGQELLRRLWAANGWLDLFRALTIQE